MRNFYIVLSLAVICMACDTYDNARHGYISFSNDTISFDTVFSSLGSVTKEIRAVNRSKDPVLLDRIYLAGREASPFRLNVNGNAGYETEDLVIPAGDSVFIFVDVNIDPTDSALPVAVLDSIVYISGGVTGRVILEAWGQDIWLIRDEVTGDRTWTEGKPYVIYGSLFVDTASVLIMEEGTRVFFHRHAKMTVAGSLITRGSADKPVLIASDRISKEYEDVPGQWRGITFLDCSRNSALNYTDIRNAETAVKLRSGISGSPDLEIMSSKLMHNSVGSLDATGSYIFAVNSVFTHSGFSTVSLSGGSSCNLIHCTIENHWDYDFRSAPAFYIGKDGGILPVVTIKNSIIAGTMKNEMYVDANDEEVVTKIYADSSFILIDTLSSEWWNHRAFIDVKVKGDPLFIDNDKYDFRPDTLSPLEDRAGKTESVLWPVDIRAKARPTGSGSDIGAYERQPGEKKKTESKKALNFSGNW